MSFESYVLSDKSAGLGVAFFDLEDIDGRPLVVAGDGAADVCLICRERLQPQARSVINYTCGHNNVHAACAANQKVVTNRCLVCTAAALRSDAFTQWQAEVRSKWKDIFETECKISVRDERAASLYMLVVVGRLTTMDYIVKENVRLRDLFGWTAEELALAGIDVATMIALCLQKTQIPLFTRLTLRDWVNLGLTLETAAQLSITHADFRTARGFCAATLAEFVAAIAPDASPEALLQHRLCPSPPRTKKGKK